ncbi:hypothetical protein BN1263170111 [Stenotrophomonas indicatrix]|nr:hypothetical protein BN1263170111 [Stenotrophomonas indicatrix]
MRQGLATVQGQRYTGGTFRADRTGQGKDHDANLPPAGPGTGPAASARVAGRRAARPATHLQR